MVAVNKALTKAKGTAPRSLAALGDDRGRNRMLAIWNSPKPRWSGDNGSAGYPSYRLSNNNANIRRIKERIEVLKRNATRETKETLHNSGVRIVENAEENRVQLFFNGKPAAEVRDKLKSHGFRWSPMAGAWQRHLNNSGIWAAKSILESLTPKEG
jgi:hypothetical protein